MDTARTSGPRPVVAVVGAGFAGLNVVHGLRNADVDVVLVDRNNFHTFQPLLYQVATGYLPAEEVGAATRSIFRRQVNATVRNAVVTGGDLENGKLLLDDGFSLQFDYLVVATGSRTNYFGIPGLEEHSWPLYTLQDAVRLKNHLVESLEHLGKNGEGIGTPTVVVIGGGPTGVETAGALSAMAGDLLGKSAADLHVVLLEATDRLLGQFSSRSSKRALADLRRRGVDVRLQTTVLSADDIGVMTDKGQISSGTLIWAAGVQANPLGQVLGLPTGRAGAVEVESDLRVKGHPNVFAAGDISASGAPPLAPAAIQSGRHVANQIRRLQRGDTTQPFRYVDKGMMAVLGRGDAVAELPTRLPIRPAKRTARHIPFGGKIAWLLWLGVHIIYLIGFRNRIKVLVDWGWSYFTSRGSNAILLKDLERPK